MQVVWNGNQDESRELVDAIARNCACKYLGTGALDVACAPHRMLVEDQRALNGLLFMRHFVARLRAEEFTRKKTEKPA